MKEYITFHISDSFASAIVNDDYTGLEDHEEIELNDFLDNLTRQYGSQDLNLIDFEDEGNFALCEVSNLMGNCLQFTLEVSQ
jgi:hypothetical protein